MIFYGQGGVEKDAVKRTVRAEFFTKRNMDIEQALLLIFAGRHFGNRAALKIQSAGKLLLRRMSHYLINHKSLPVFPGSRTTVCLFNKRWNKFASFVCLK